MCVTSLLAITHSLAWLLNVGKISKARSGRRAWRSGAFLKAAVKSGSTVYTDDASTYGSMLENDLPELLSFFSFPHHLWRKLRTTHVIERLFVEVRRRTLPMVCFVKVKSVDRIIYSIFHRFNLEWENRTLKFLHKPLEITRGHYHWATTS